MILKNLSKCFADLKVLEDFHLEIKEKEITCILGPSGCGKSTLLNMISGITSPDQGEIVGKKEKIGYVFQEDRLLPWKTLEENIRMVKKTGHPSEIRDLIEKVGLKNFEKSYPHQLSGGMRQRCAIARAYHYQSEMLLMDEPFKSLDYDLRMNMVKMLQDLWTEWGNTVVFVTHEIDEALLLGNRIILLKKNPCTVDQVIEIKTPQSQRTLMDNDLLRAREIIIDGMTNKKKRKCHHEKSANDRINNGINDNLLCCLQ
ncbi:NitT/TauT family transport system ATP-binding protein [Tindallia magadiensis]|uniref:NitT/TauT family transport system ATP-binding protein n=1 Tax=Tindallia magadiensis TaxID=69895 RepID=A0A1I3FEX9_9FIRM|nr:ABC transporter ATP-binding protein [Tindallia magadiensis]SFI09727.1 NitT/TauT family transport system ATP-binding protein [Tindallia magadiensis]